MTGAAGAPPLTTRIIPHRRVCTCVCGAALLLIHVYLLYSVFPLFAGRLPWSANCGPTANTVQLSLVYRSPSSSGSSRKHRRIISPELYSRELLYSFVYTPITVYVLFRQRRHASRERIITITAPFPIAPLCTGSPKPPRRCRRRRRQRRRGPPGRAVAGCSCRAPGKATTTCATCRPCTPSGTYPPR